MVHGRTPHGPGSQPDYRTPNALPYISATLEASHTTLGGHQRRMSSLVRRFRGLGIALAVLAISAGAALAAAPSMTLTSSHNPDKTGHALAADPSSSVEPSESAEPSDSAEPSEVAAPSESASPSDSPSPSESAAPSASPSPSASPDPISSAENHGTLVSTAAKMATPAGFPNHGSFVSCVAHLDASPIGFDWSTVTPAFCGITPAASASDSARAHGHGNSHATGQAHGNGHPKGPTGH